MKCSKCGEQKDAAEFYLRASGYFSYCKPCGNRSSMAWADKNKERRLAVAAAWRRRNKASVAAAKRRWRAKSKVDVCADNAYRKARRIRATPAWANRFFIREAYDLAQLRTKCTGFAWHVDHIVPLRSRRVCGLHVEANLAVVPAVVNLAKNNRTWPDMPT